MDLLTALQATGIGSPTDGAQKKTRNSAAAKDEGDETQPCSRHHPQALQLGDRRGYLAANPAVGVEMLDEEERDRVLSDEEIVRLWNVCDSIGWPFGPLFRILFLTAQRRDEVAEMRWSELDLNSALWTLPKERAKNDRTHEVPLAPYVVEILSALPRIEENDLVFTTNSLFQSQAPARRVGRREKLAAPRPPANGGHRQSSGSTRTSPTVSLTTNRLSSAAWQSRPRYRSLG